MYKTLNIVISDKVHKRFELYRKSMQISKSACAIYLLTKQVEKYEYDKLYFLQKYKKLRPRTIERSTPNEGGHIVRLTVKVKTEFFNYMNEISQDINDKLIFLLRNMIVMELNEQLYDETAVKQFYSLYAKESDKVRIRDIINPLC